MRFELHCHSTCSDGTDAPESVAARAAERKVDIFALTDHDTTSGFASAVPASASRCIRGTELTCAYEGRTVHVLIYDKGGDWSAVETLLAAISQARRDRLQLMADRLKARGVTIDVAPLLATNRSVGRPDLARAMVAAGAVKTPRDAFTRHLYDGGPVDVPHRTADIAAALEAGRQAGAAMSLAHPHHYDHQNGAPLAPVLVRKHRDLGLTGLEAFYGIYDTAARRRWTTLADELGLVCTAGSDWHGRERAGAQMNATSNVELGVDLPDKRGEALLRWLS
ncbi:MAG: PHP domain-containing protein [Proteobacteria bacterium]|nr:PHP domain-containing protein [Pseudomonadota bacterium]